MTQSMPDRRPVGGNDAGYVCPQCGPDSRGSERHTWYRHTFAGLFDGEAFPGDAEDSGRSAEGGLK